MIKWFALSCCFSAFYTFAEPAGEKFIIAAAELTGLFNLSGPPDAPEPDGIYYQLLQRILQETGQDNHYQLLIMPMRRAKQMFKQQQAACYVPGLDTFDPDEKAQLPDNLNSSTPINRALVRVVSRDPQRLISKPDDIRKTDSISVVRGVPVSAAMNQMLQRAGSHYLVTSEQENLKLLSIGRVDFVLAFYPDVIHAYQSLGITQPYPFDPTYSPLEIIDNVLCHVQHDAVIKLIDIRLKQYSRDGTLQQLLGESYLPATTPS